MCQRCPSRLKICRYRTTTIKRKSVRAATASRPKTNATTPLRCRNELLKKLPLSPQLDFRKCFENQCHQGIKSAPLVLISQIHSLSEYYTYRHRNPVQVHAVLQCTLKKSCRSDVVKISRSPLPRFADCLKKLPLLWWRCGSDGVAMSITGMYKDEEDVEALLLLRYFSKVFLMTVAAG
jgi:hypothetical protein